LFSARSLFPWAELRTDHRSQPDSEELAIATSTRNENVLIIDSLAYPPSDLLAKTKHEFILYP
jgi:hypothetical protein